MESPAEERAGALKELEPLRLEFQMVDRDELRKGTNTFRWLILGGFVLPVIVLAVWQREPLVILPALLALLPWLLFVEWNRHRLRSLMPQRLVLQGTALTIERRAGSGVRTDDFDLLQVRGMRPTGMGQVITWWMYSAWQYSSMWPEAIAFSYRGSHWSFGGYALRPAEAEEVVARIADYDRQIRERLGMRLEPNVRAYDAAQPVFDPIEGWNPGLPGRFRVW